MSDAKIYLTEAKRNLYKGQRFTKKIIPRMTSFGSDIISVAPTNSQKM
jgi:hypothetical protein